MRLVLAGAGHAHVGILKGLAPFIQRGWFVDVVSLSSFHYYSGMGPGLLGGDYTPEETRFPVRELTEAAGAAFHEDRIIGIEAASNRVHLASGGTIRYDLLSCNLGSQINAERLDVSADVAPGFFYPVKPIENLYAARQALLQLPAGTDAPVLVVGGGPAAVEIAGNAAEVLEARKRDDGVEAAGVCLCAGGEFLRYFPPRLQDIASRSLESRGVRIRQGHIRTVLPRGVECEDGSSIQAALVILATGVKAPTWLGDTDLTLGEDGGILVDASLRSISHSNVFAVGDCASFAPFPLRKVAVHAVRQSPVLRANLLGCMGKTGDECGEVLRRFSPQSQFLLILNLGGQKGVGTKWGLTIDGRWAYSLKDRIDRRFVGSSKA